MKDVKSSNIARVGYSPGSRTLAVEFKNGSVYHHHDVPPEVFEDLMGAGSHGKHYNSAVKGKFSPKKIK